MNPITLALEYYVVSDKKETDVSWYVDSSKVIREDFRFLFVPFCFLSIFTLKCNSDDNRDIAVSDIPYPDVSVHF